MRNADDGLFPALEAALKAASEPLDCNDLFEMPEVRKHALSVNRVSDYLGGLWRKGLVVRLPAASENSRARWAYQWKGRKTKYSGPLTSPDELPPEAISYTPKIVADRPSVLITEEGKTMTIQMDHVVIVIKQTN